MANYSPPGVEIYQEFSAAPQAITNPRQAHIAGGHAFLLRHADPDERAAGSLGAYVAGLTTSYSWPGRPAGARVDAGYTKVHADAARLRTFLDEIGTDSTITPVAGKPQRVRISGTTGFADNGTAYPRDGRLYSRDVRPGDWVRVAGPGGSLVSRVTALIPDQTAAVVGAAAADAGNPLTASALVTVSQTGGIDNAIELAADDSLYSALVDGALLDVYTVEVTRGSTGGDLSTALLRITTASGLDDSVVVPAPAGDAFAVGYRGLRLTFSRNSDAEGETDSDDLIAGQIWQVTVRDLYTAVVAASGGTYAGTSDTTYIVECVRGGFFNEADPSLRPLLKVTTTHGIDAAGPVALDAPGTNYPIGALGATIRFTGTPAGIPKGAKWRVAVTSPRDSRVATLELAHVLPTSLQSAADLELELALVDDVVIPRLQPDGITTNWGQSDTALTLRDAVLLTHPEVTNASQPVPLALVGGDLSVEYRAWRSELCGSVGTVTAFADIDALISGPNDPDNPLKYGVTKALANSNGVEVKFTSVCDPEDVDSWAAVLDLLSERDDVYGLVPLTRDPAVIALYQAHVNNASGALQGSWRTGWYSLGVESHLPRVSAATTTNSGVALATILDDPATPGTQYTYLQLTSANADFLELGVRPGDTVRTAYGQLEGEITYVEYEIDAVLGAVTLRLVAGPAAPVEVPQKIEVWHARTRDEEAEAIRDQAAAYGDRRSTAVWPDTLLVGAREVEGYFLCAAEAGLRSGLPPHESLTRKPIIGFTGTPRSRPYFSREQLNTIASGGAFVVLQTPAGVIQNRHALTADMRDENHRLEMIRSNLDDISYTLSAALDPLIGTVNLTGDAVAGLQHSFDEAVLGLKATTVPRLGPQIVSLTVVRFGRHAVEKSRMVVVCSVELPYELGKFEIHLVV